MLRLRPALVSSVVLALWLLCMYVPTLAEGVTFSDGPEIAAAIVTLAVIHPTGYPLFTLLAHYFQLVVPTNAEPCYEIALFNALAATIAGLLLAASVRALARRSARPSESEAPLFELWCALGGMGVALFFGLSPLLWNQVRIPEVYPFHILLVSWSLYRWVCYETRGRRSIDIVWAALPMGLGLAHHVTIVYMLPAAFVYVLWTRPLFFVEWLLAPWAWLRRRLGRPSERLEARLSPAPWHFLIACVIGGVPLAFYLYLWWANNHTTGIPWGGIDGWTPLYNHMTGAQYRHYMKGFAFDGLWDRLKVLPESYYEVLFVPGVVLTLVGLWRAFRRMPPMATFLLLYAIFTLCHGLQYGVGDYRNYFLPAYGVFGVFFGLGTYTALSWLSAKGQRASRVLSFVGSSVFVALLVLMLLDIGSFHLALASAFGTWHIVSVSLIGALLLGWVVWVHGLVPRLRLSERLAWLGQNALSFCLVGCLAVTLLSVGIARGKQVSKRSLIGSNHAASVSRELPPGALYMTMGDGFIFSQWYQQHALLDGIDSAVLNIRKVNGGWYQRFLRTRYPAACDPVYGELIRDPAAYAEKCSDFERRMSLPSGPAWFRTPKSDYRTGRQIARDAFIVSGNVDYGLYDRVLTGADAKCSDKTFRTKNADKCRCWGTDKRPFEFDAYCVPSYAGNGIATREVEEILAERVVEDNIDSYPVFERNVLTRWVSGSQNKRKWDGPAYQRPSDRYTLINRGRSNQFVYTDDVLGQEVCDAEQLERVQTPRLSPPTNKISPRIQDRQKFQPSEWPILISQSFLTPKPKDSSDRGRVVFSAGETIHLHTDWFERWEYDVDKPKRRGPALSYGLRACAFDPSGKRVWTKDMVSGGKNNSAVWAMPIQGNAALGSYTLQACSVGPVKAGTNFSDLPCIRPILEYDFQIEAGGGKADELVAKAPNAAP